MDDKTNFSKDKKEILLNFNIKKVSLNFFLIRYSNFENFNVTYFENAIITILKLILRVNIFANFS